MTTPSNAAEQALQAISDRLEKLGIDVGLDSELSKLRIVYGSNNYCNQTVIYGALASGKFRDSNNISEAQATAILDAINEPVSVSVPEANTRTGNLPNARIQVFYDNNLYLRQEKTSENSITPLHQHQEQEQDSQVTVEASSSQAAHWVDAPQQTSLNDQREHEVERETDELYHDPDDLLNRLSYEDLVNGLRKERQERAGLRPDLKQGDDKTLEELFAEFDQRSTEASSQVQQHKSSQNIDNAAIAPRERNSTEPTSQPLLEVGSPPTRVELKPPTAVSFAQIRPQAVEPSSASLTDWLESGDWASNPEMAGRVVSWAKWYEGNEGLINSTSVLSPAAIAVGQMPESNSKQFARTLITDLQNQPEQVAEQQSTPRSSSPLEPEQRSFTPLAAALDRVAHRVVDRAVQWLDSKLVDVERRLEKVGKWWSSRAEAIQNHHAAEVSYKLFDRGFNRTEETQYQHHGFQVEKVENEKNSSVFILRDTQTGNDLLKFRAEQRLHTDPKLEVLAKARGGMAQETIQRLTDLESDLRNVRGSDRGEEQRSQNVERFAQVARLVNEFGSTRNSRYVVDSGRTEAGEDWLRVTARGSRGVVYEQRGSEVREDLQSWDFRRSNAAYATVETAATASQQTNDRER